MKKAFKYLAIAVLAVAVSTGFAACSSDEDNDSILNDGSHDAEMIGTWEHIYEDAYDTETQTYTFKKNGRYEFSEIEYDKTDKTTESYKEKGVWYTHGSRLYIEVTSSVDPDEIGEQSNFNYFVDNKELYIDGDVFKKKK